MTWLSTWPEPNPQYATHLTEGAAERHAAEIVRSGRAVVATYYEIEEAL